MIKGIDISNHNGVIDFNAVKNAGIEFAIIRSSYGWFYKDNMVDNYVRGCESVGMHYGFYHYSYALNLDQAKIEADKLIALIKNYNPKYPVIVDMEDADGWKKRNGFPSNDMHVQIAEYICKRIEEAGYYAMIYANLSWFNTILNDSRLDRFDKWLAQWSVQPTYGKRFGMWQYTSNGVVPGTNGRVDMNYAYQDYSAWKSGTPVAPTPAPQPTPAPAQNISTYTIKPGDTLTGIAAKFNTTVANLASINGIANPDKIGAGQTIKVTGTTNVVSNRTYKVLPGDGLIKIGKKLGVNWIDIANKNGLKDPYTIYAGQVLKI